MNSTVVTVKDNIVVYNNGEIGSGVTNRYSGIQIDRGDLADVRGPVVAGLRIGDPHKLVRH